MKIFVVTFKPDCAGPDIEVYVYKYLPGAVAKFLEFAEDSVTAEELEAFVTLMQGQVWDGSPILLGQTSGCEIVLAQAHLER